MPAAYPALTPESLLICLTQRDASMESRANPVEAPLFASVQALRAAKGGETRAILACRAGQAESALAQTSPTELVVEWLPVPLGRTIARNWLLAHPEVQASPWVLFLEEGMIPPPDWLTLLQEAVAAYPEARSWGCRDTPETPGGQLLVVDSTSSGETADLSRLDAAPFHLVSASEIPDFVTCLTMPGSCRLFRTDRLLQDGGWSLAFAPAWGADMERDMALALAHNTLPCVCQENLVIEATPHDPAEQRVNQFKLAHRFSPEELAAVSSLCHPNHP